MEERANWYGTGIADEGAARRYLRNKFRRTSLELPVVRPGERFYVTARANGRTAFLFGPYSTHMIALQNVPRARAKVYEISAWGAFWALGTASSPKTIDTVYGR